MKLSAALVALLLFLPAAASAGAGSPDLVVAQPTASGPYRITDRYFDANLSWDNCSIVEGSVPSAGWHRLLEFPTDVANVGTADLKIGNPAAHPEWFTFAPCHGHYHVPLADYQLLDATGAVAAVGHKQGFCLTDSYVYDPLLTRSTRPRYTGCNRNQGISRGWADDYSMGLDGQWVVVDGLAPGSYTLVVTINASRVLPESNYTNNTQAVSVTIVQPT